MTLTVIAMAAAACAVVGPSLEMAAVPEPSDTVRPVPAAQPACPVTQPPDPPFIPPAPWPPQPPGQGQFWFGNEGLWTALPAHGSWRQLAFGDKFWWWSREFDVSEDSTPDITVSARRLDEAAPPFIEVDATNGYHSSFHWAMLVGVQLPSVGCWEVTGEYKGHRLAVVIWVPDHLSP